MQPKASQSILFIVWIRHIVLTAELFQFIEDHSGEGQQQEVFDEVDTYCSRLEEMTEEWNIVRTSPAVTYASWLIQDETPRSS
jgi:hypothetical protein